MGWLGGEGDTTAPETDMPPVPDASPDSSRDQIEDPGSVDTGGSTPPEDTVPSLSGIALARQFLDGGPTPAAIFERAEQLEQASDCPAAYALFSEAANADPIFAARLARRYDPLTHRPSACIAAPDIPYAIVYYSDAAEAARSIERFGGGR
jgi:hypothetical protein